MGEKMMKKEEICESFCFQCKDGSSLRIYDYGDCLKAYHPNCVNKDDSFLESEGPWTCRWHFCFNCTTFPKYRCFCCPKAICGRCIRKFEFSVIGYKKGLCDHCLTLAGIIEGVKNPDSHQGKIDFNDQETYESLLKEYWEMVKEKEGLDSIDVCRAFELLDVDRNLEDLPDSSRAGDFSQGEDFCNGVHLNEMKRTQKLKKCKGNGGRKVYSKKKDFSGWASNRLFDFLHSIGKDSTEKLSEHDVSAIIIEYCNEYKLFYPEKKKKVVCDAKLKSLLGRKSVQKNRIHNLLDPHFAENFEQSENELAQSENEHEKISKDKSESAPISFKRQRSSSSDIKPQKNEAIDLDVHPKGRFTSVVAENIRRLYLNRSLIEELSEKPETFDDKVIRSFVRIKSDPYDYLQKNSHMLVKVTGIKRTSRKDELTKDILLQVSGMPKDIPISLLLNDNLSEEECQDLRRRVKDGRLEWLSLVEFEEKARSLHEVITKQWIAKELYRLDKLIDQANRKGWRRELHAYIERKQLLETPSEQSRLLQEFPEVIADKTEVESTDKQHSRKDLFPESDSRELSKPCTKDAGGDCAFPCTNDVADLAGNPIACIPQAQPNSILTERPKKNEQNRPGSELIKICDNEQDNTVQVSKETILELSSDSIGESKKIEDDPNSRSWYCMSPLCVKAGPYSMSLLKEWNDAFPNELTFKVWNTNQSPKEAISPKKLFRSQMQFASFRMGIREF